MNFGQALELIKQGKKVYRSSWNDVGKWLEIEVPDLFSTMTLPYIYIEYPNGSRYPWFASQIDIFAEDWKIKEEEDA